MDREVSKTGSALMQVAYKCDAYAMGWDIGYRIYVHEHIILGSTLRKVKTLFFKNKPEKGDRENDDGGSGNRRGFFFFF